MSKLSHVQKEYHPNVWTSHASKFPPVENPTVPLDKDLVQLVDEILPFDSADCRVFDNGCGRGALTSVIDSKSPHVHLLATDISPGIFDRKKASASKEKWEYFDKRALDSRKLEGVADNFLTYTLSTFMICPAQDLHLIVEGMYCVTEPVGILGLATWSMPYYDFEETP